MKIGLQWLFLVAALAIVLVAFAIIQPRFMNHVNRARTFDYMGEIYVTITRTLETQPLKEYDAVSEARKIFPSLPVSNGAIVDAWGNPMRISIERIKDGFHVTLTSAGRDGVFGTKDDLVENYMLPDTK